MNKVNPISRIIRPLVGFFSLVVLTVSFQLSSALALDLGGDTLDIKAGHTFATQYMFRGVDTFGDEPAFQPYGSATVNLDRFHISGGYWGSYPEDSEFDILAENDFWGAVGVDLNDYLNFTTTYTYYNFYNAPRTGDVNEFSFVVTMSEIPVPGFKLGPIEDKIPISISYAGSYAFGRASFDEGGINDGWYHAITAGFAIPIPGTKSIPFQEENGLALNYSSTWGFYGGSQYIFEDGYAHWTHGLTIPIALPGNITVTPGFYYQISFNDSVNPENEFYFMIDTSIAF